MGDKPQASSPTPTPPIDDLEAVNKLRDAYGVIKSELGRIIVGQDRVIEELIIALFARGHVILEGVPGLAKTLMISSLARCLGLKFHRIQFTPDLMPSDITGTEVIQEDRSTGHRSFRFLKGPIFANVVLADEVNRTPPKTQAALLEAMQETQVTIGGMRHPIEKPFFVLATQNPIEQEGTYPLPEAQQDRFMFKVFVDYPTYDEEYEIAERTTSGDAPELKTSLERDEILMLQDVVRRVPAAPSVIQHALGLARASRPGPDSSELINRMVTYGAGPRAVQFLLLGGKARAVIQGRKHVSYEDIRALAKPVLRHRIITNYAADAEGYSTDKIVDHILENMPPRPADGLKNAGVHEVLKT